MTTCTRPDCGQKIPPNRKQHGGEARFCSSKCQRLVYDARRAAEKKARRAALRAGLPIPEPEKIILTCPYCGNEFVKNPRTPHMRFCCQTCRDRWNTTNKGYKVMDKDAARTCGWCGKDFLPHQNNQIYCSTRCCSRALNKKRREADKAERAAHLAAHPEEAKPTPQPVAPRPTHCRVCGKQKSGISAAGLCIDCRIIEIVADAEERKRADVTLDVRLYDLGTQDTRVGEKISGRSGGWKAKKY